MRKVRERNDKRLSFEGGSEFLPVPQSFSAHLHFENPSRDIFTRSNETFSISIPLSS